jgi:prepilin-type N-terminal cleavage/methylation domain-containing protein
MKIKAFTLMEVTVAMLISAICITICYSAYALIANYYAVFQEKNEKADAVMGLKQVLEKDFLRAQLILKTDSGLTVNLDSAVVVYSFKEGKVLRGLQGLHTDTFRVAAAQPSFSFEQKPIIEPDTVDQVSLKVRLDKSQTTTILIVKLYSAETLFH